MSGIKALVLAAAVAVGSWLVSATPAQCLRTFAPDGPYHVGVMIEHLQLGDRVAPALIWYPARPAAGSESFSYPGDLKGSAVKNAPVDASSAPYPLIMFSHGMGACGSQSVYYTENLASFGYVVVAPDHKDSAMCHIEGEPDVTIGQVAWAAVKGAGDLGKTVFSLFGDKFDEMGFDFSYRPAEASATIDQALLWNRNAAHPMHAMMDFDRIGITGHSLGGFTTLMAGGVPFHCEGVELAPGECNPDNMTLSHAISPCCMESLKNADPFQARDPRVKAMLALGPAVFFPDLEKAASEIEIPVMVITGGHEKMEVPWEPIWTLYQNAPPPKYVVRLKKTDHMTISDQTLAASSIVKPFLTGFRFNYDQKARAYKDYSAAFFNLYLKGDASRAGVLHAPENKFVELWYEEP